VNSTSPERVRTLHRALLWINLAILAILLIFGLKPFHEPANEVTWVSGENALRFRDPATVISVGTFAPNGSAGRSLEIWVTPGLRDDSSTLLAFYDPKEPRGFTLHQSATDLELRLEPWVAWRPPPMSHMYIDGAFNDGARRLWAVTSGPAGTTIYRDGVKLRGPAAFFPSDHDFTGRLVIGTSPISNDSWLGVLGGLAIYNRSLTAEEVSRHFASWTKTGAPAISAEDACEALYLLDEHGGGILHTRLGSGNDLRVPAKYVLLNPTVIDPVWRAFSWSRGFWTDALINVAGFVPFGFFFCALLSAKGFRRTVVITSVLGGLLSLFIELTQVFLPTRDSSMSDLILNTAGSLLGAVLYVSLVSRGIARLRP
jgi:hypothetical protein